MAQDGLMVSVSGIRGRVGEALTPEVVAMYAAAFGAWALKKTPGRPVVVGRDSRVSGPMFHRVAIGALESVGAHVIDIGLTTTPTCQLAVEDHHAAGGIMISASHNPIEWNALKLIGPTGMFLEEAEAQAMRAIADGKIPRVTWDKLGKVEQDSGAAKRHIERILKIPYVDVAAIRKRKFKVALDCVRGAGAVIVPQLLEHLGCSVTAIHVEPDGRFPRPPEPVAENLTELEALVKKTGADIGIAVDPDVDRLALVSEKGAALGEDYTLALACLLVLKHRTGAAVTNLSTSKVVEDAVAKAGSKLTLAPVGEINVVVRMRELRAVIGGEGNGGVILPEVHLGRDAPVGIALILQLLTEANKPLSAIAAELPKYAIVKDKLDRPKASLDTVYDALERTFGDAEVDTQDGLRLAWKDRWLHVRPSGTEPIVRVIAEAPTPDEARDLVDRARAQLMKLTAPSASVPTVGAAGR
jgi:phosphomannomutase